MNGPDDAARGYAVFLRGVNVAGTPMKMADLTRELAALPVRGVKTLLASGNVVLQCTLRPEELKAQVEERLRAAFGYDAWVVVVDHERLGQLVEACPYPADSAVVHAYVTLFSSEPALREWVAEAGAGGADVVVLSPEAVAWQTTVGKTLESTASKLTMARTYKPVCTTRNLRTLHKVLAAFERVA